MRIKNNSPVLQIFPMASARHGMPVEFEQVFPQEFEYQELPPAGARPSAADLVHNVDAVRAFSNAVLTAPEDQRFRRRSRPLRRASTRPFRIEHCRRLSPANSPL
jgi:hypothetical protein